MFNQPEILCVTTLHVMCSVTDIQWKCDPVFAVFPYLMFIVYISLFTVTNFHRNQKVQKTESRKQEEKSHKRFKTVQGSIRSKDEEIELISKKV